MLILTGLVFTTAISVCHSSLQAFNPNNPFVYPVPPLVSLIATNPFINKSQAVFNEPFANEKAEQIGDYYYHRAKECGIHFLNPKEGLIINDKMFANGENRRCMWGFVGNLFCTPSVECPKFIPKKRKADCRSNYLQITDDESFSLHFCDGFSYPGKKEYTAASGVLDITYRYSSLYERPQFECLVRCVQYGANFTTSVNSENETTVEVFPPKKTYLSKLLHPRMLKDCKCGITNSPDLRPNTTSYTSANKHYRVLGGRETAVSQYPWMVGLVHKAKLLPFCGASLINDRYVLTATHCLEDEELGDFDVILNEHDYFTNNETFGKSVKRGIAEMIPYQYYLDSTFFGDMALLLLDKPVDVTKFTFTPICLPKDSSNTYADYDVIGAGWGTVSENGEKSPKLLEVLLKVMNNAVCNDYHSSRLPEPPQVTDTMLCAGYAEGGRDTCSGDSGGPLITYENQRFTQIGVTSWGFGCGVKLNPGIFSRVTSFLNWIRMHTPDAIWCH